MGLDNSKEELNSKQLSLFDYQLPKVAFVSKSSSFDASDWEFTQAEPSPNKIPRFVTVSAMVHVAAILLVSILAVPLIEEVKTETITIELEDTNPPMQVSQGAPTIPTQGASTTTESSATEAALSEALDEALTPEDIVVAKMIPKELPAKTLTVKTPKMPAPPKAKAEASPIATATAKSAATKTDFKAVPATIDDIDAPELEQGALAAAAAPAKLDDEDLNEDFAKVDDSHKAVLEEEKKSLDEMASAVENEQNETLSAVAEANQEEAQRLAAVQDALREKNASEIASAKQAEENARAAAAAREAAAMAKLANEGQAEKQGPGAGNNGASTQGATVAGAASGIRSLDQLRQMPGNPRPYYDREERRRGDQGEIAFVAYISKEGYPTKFRLMKSTGFRNLDSKTLAALKKWRFYPGQEGWVELPFRWDLKGGVQQDGGMLRREVVGSR